MSTIAISTSFQETGFELAWVTIRPGWIVSNVEYHKGSTQTDLWFALHSFILEFDYFDIENIVAKNVEHLWEEICTLIEVCNFYDFLYSQEEYCLQNVPSNEVPDSLTVSDSCEYYAEWYVKKQLA